MSIKKLTLATLTFGLMLGASLPVVAAEKHAETHASEKKEAAKPIVAVIKASWCPACRKIEPTVKQVMKKSMAEADWVVFDISTKENAQKAAAQAKAMGLDSFFKDYGTKTATVAIIHPETKKVLKVLMAESRENKYAEALKAAQAAI